MSYRFIIGLSGSGKTQNAINYLLNFSRENLKRRFYYIVPEQFTLETQKALCDMAAQGSVMDVEILSFERLAFMVFKELGLRLKPVISDSGKNLILRKIAGDNKERLKVLKAHTKNLSYIDEVKSLISELMQYGSGPLDLSKVLDEGKNAGNRLLNAKADDIVLLYTEFLNFLVGNYETPETTLNLFLDNIEKSSNLKDSVFVFDGFTGFTPIQNSIIKKLLSVANELVFTVTMNPNEDKFSYINEDDLYYMSKNMIKTVRDMGSKENEPIKLSGERKAPYMEIVELKNPKEELISVRNKIKKLVSRGVRYKSIAILSGDMDRYIPYIKEVFSSAEIPVFTDKTLTVDHHPLFIFLRATALIIEKDFGKDGVLRFLRCGFLDIDNERIDRLSNYIRATGIRGEKAYSKDFTLLPKGVNTSALEEINETRQIFVAPLLELKSKINDGEGSFLDYSNALYNFLLHFDVEKKLFLCEDEGIYNILMENLERICTLLPSEKSDFAEFMDVVFSGLKGSKLGKLPKYSDMVTFGDTVRTRVSCDHLFVIGANEGVLPNISGSGGFFSDRDRMTLKKMGLSLAPTERERQFQGAFYMDLLLKRPNKSLIISYSRADSSGEALRPSFILDDILEKNPGLSIVNESIEDSVFITTLGTKKEDIEKELVKSVLGELKVSVSKLENYANCSYAYFLRYILGLNEEVLYGLKNSDYGNIYHDSIYNYYLSVKEMNLDIESLSDVETEDLLNSSVKLALNPVSSKGDYSSETDKYTFMRIKETLKRTIKVLSNQIIGGGFVPDSFETEISSINGKENLKLALDSGEMVTLTGKIDRIDLKEKGNCLYVKIIDYKSGNTKFDLSRLKGGLQIQLLYYLDAKTKALMKKFPDKEILPSCMFYYHIDNPTLTLTKEDSPGAVEALFEKELRPTGLILNDNEVFTGLDKNFDMSGKYESNLVKLSTKNDGSLSSRGDYIDKADFDYLISYAEKIVKENAQNISEGKFKKNPYRLGDDTGCKYCPYKSVCGFDVSFGDKYRDIAKVGNMEEFKADGL